MEMLCEYGLVQCNKDPICNEHILDLVCVHGGQCNVHKTEKAMKSTLDALHCELLCACRPMQDHEERFVYNYRKADFIHLIHLLHCSPWSFLTDTTSIDEGFDLFHDFVYAAINECVPRIRIRVCKYPIWYDNDMISSLKENDNSHKALKRSHSLTDYQAFSELRTNFKKRKRERYYDYISQIEQSVKLNTKRLFSVAKSNQTNVNTPNLMEYNGIEAGSLVDIAELFSDYFQSVFTSVDNLDYPFQSDQLSHINVSYENVIGVLRSTNVILY